ncbi:MAG: rhomboid family intramembrane serine protease [Pseudomonadota bacterium]
MSRELYRGALDEDLRTLSALLAQQQIVHKIAEVRGAQVVLLAVDDDEERAAALLERWRRGDAEVSTRSVARAERRPSPLSVALRAPVTLTLIVVAILGFLLVVSGAPVSWVAKITYQPFAIVNGRAEFGVASGEYWRLVTPVFLHFGWMHIVFNCLWCWELGKRIEVALGSLNLAGLFLVTAVLSNSVQHAVSGPVLFGGLSGVVYGFLGFSWVAGRLNRRWLGLAPPTPIMLFMVGWLLVCIVGVFDVLGFSVANGAHVGGLLTGALLGAVFAVAYRGGATGAAP